MLDHYTRNDLSEHTCGILMGIIGYEGTVDIRSCFPLKINITDTKLKINDDILVNRVKMEQYFQKINFVGWYSCKIDQNLLDKSYQNIEIYLSKLKTLEWQ